MNVRIAKAGALIAAALAMLAVPAVASGQETASDEAVATEEQSAEASGDGSSETTSPDDTADDTEGVESADPAEPVVETASTEVEVESEANATTAETGVERTEREPSTTLDTSGSGCLAKRGGSDNPQVHDDLEAAGCTVSIDVAQQGETVRTIDGIEFTFSIKVNQDGEEILQWETDEPFTGTILVKGGKFHFTCQVTDDDEGTCHAPVNPNTNRFHDISHVDVCVGENIPPPPDGPGPDREVEQEFGGGGPTAVATAAPAEGLPFTGLDAHWLLLVGGSLLGCGALVRKRIA